MLGLGRLAKSVFYDLRLGFGDSKVKFLKEIAPDYAEYRRLVRLIIVSTSKRYAYFVSNKVGSTSVRNLLNELESGQSLDDPKDVWDQDAMAFTVPKELTFEEFREICSSDTYFRFSFVRNPFDRLVSAYVYSQKMIAGGKFTRNKMALYRHKRDPRRDEKIRKLMNFESFVEGVCREESFDQDKHWRPQYDILKFDKIDYGFIGKFENMEADLGVVLRRLGAKPDIIAKAGNKTNASQGRPSVKTFFNDRLAEIVRETYRNDFEAFNYPLDLPD